MHVYDDISLNSCQNEKQFHIKIVEKIKKKKKHALCPITFFPEDRAV
jgi:hypothetical protein